MTTVVDSEMAHMGHNIFLKTKNICFKPCTVKFSMFFQHYLLLAFFVISYFKNLEFNNFFTKFEGSKRYFWCLNVLPLFFSTSVFIHDHSQSTGMQGKGKGISLTPHYNFHLLCRNLRISREITEESSPLHIGSSQTQTRNFCFQSKSCQQLNYVPWFFSKVFKLEQMLYGLIELKFLLKTLCIQITLSLTVNQIFF